jgi:hypothetical protein
MNPRRTALASWIDTALPGARYVYHTGHLIHDRLVNADLDLTAAYAWEEAAKGRVLLTQLRATCPTFGVWHGETLSSEPVYLYFATRSKRYWTGGQGNNDGS